jgi:hypothetical protein
MIDFLQILFDFDGIIGIISTEYERAHFQALHPKISIHLNKIIENFDNNIHDEYGFSTNDIFIEKKQNVNENETKEETKEGKNKFLQHILQVILKLVLLIIKRNQKKKLEQYIPTNVDFTYTEKEKF